MALALSVLCLFSCRSVSRQDLNDAPEGGRDDTAWIQALLDAPEGETLIPAGIWYTRELFLTASDKRIVFAKGCEIVALRGAFLDTGSCLLTVRGARNLVISGHGARLRMRRADYAAPPYAKGEWRHGIALYECTDVRIEGLTIEGTGGDGVYIGQGKGDAVCADIELRALTLRDNYRQGVSVIAARGFLMEDCRVEGTKGTIPMAGIDFEPNSGVYGLTGCVLRGCRFTRNGGPGVLVYLKKLNAGHPPVDILVENCVSRGNRFAVSVMEIPEGLRGSLTFRRCSLSWLKFLAVPAAKSPDSFRVLFE